MMDKDEYESLCEDVIATCLKMNALGINQGTSGNVSAKIDDSRFAITPSGQPYESLKTEDIVVVQIQAEDSNSPHGYYGEPNRRPSSEWRIHHDIYRRFPAAKAIVHTHSTFCTALSACEKREKIPAFHYMVAAAGGKDIRISKYATFGTQTLSDNVLEALEGRKACVMGNHGQIAFGDNCAKALWLANEVECLSKQYMHLLSTNEPIAVLDDDEMARVLEKFKTYGKSTAAKDTKASSGALNLLGSVSTALTKRKREGEE